MASATIFIILGLVSLVVVVGIIVLVVALVRARPRPGDADASTDYAGGLDQQVRSAPTAGMRGDVSGPGAGF